MTRGEFPTLRDAWLQDQKRPSSDDRWPFLVDVDGVCLQFVEPLYAAIGLARTLEETLDWDFVPKLPEPYGARAWAVLSDYDWWASLPPLVDAVAGIAALRELGPVVFATSPYDSCRGWEHARRHLLKKHFDASRRDVVVTPRKELLRGRTLIDDKPDHVDLWTTCTGGRFQHPAGILFDAPYNRAHKSPFLGGFHIRAVGWSDVLVQVANHKL